MNYTSLQLLVLEKDEMLDCASCMHLESPNSIPVNIWRRNFWGRLSSIRKKIFGLLFLTKRLSLLERLTCNNFRVFKTQVFLFRSSAWSRLPPRTPVALPSSRCTTPRSGSRSHPESRNRLARSSRPSDPTPASCKSASLCAKRISNNKKNY